MSLFKWEDKYSVGVKKFDDDHRKLIDYLNQAFDLMTQKRPKEEIKSVLSNLSSYTVVHFSNEENIFKQYSYPDYKSHKEEHDQFIAKIEDFYKGYNSGKLMLTMEVMNFLKKWLVSHISKTDQKYGPFLNKHGVF